MIGLCVSRLKGQSLGKNQMSVFMDIHGAWSDLKKHTAESTLVRVGDTVSEIKKDIYIIQYASNFRCNGYICMLVLYVQKTSVISLILLIAEGCWKI